MDHSPSTVQTQADELSQLKPAEDPPRLDCQILLAQHCGRGPRTDGLLRNLELRLGSIS